MTSLPRDETVRLNDAEFTGRQKRQAILDKYGIRRTCDGLYFWWETACGAKFRFAENAIKFLERRALHEKVRTE